MDGGLRGELDEGSVKTEREDRVDDVMAGHAVDDADSDDRRDPFPDRMVADPASHDSDPDAEQQHENVDGIVTHPRVFCFRLFFDKC